MIAMDPVVQKNILRLLGQAKDAIRKGDTFGLKELSNGNIHNASIFQDEDSLGIAVTLYALSKIIDRGKLPKNLVIGDLQKAESFLAKSNIDAYRASLKSLVNRISREDFRMRKFVSTVIEQANIKKGCALCEHGISISRVSTLLGISKWELMQYLGKTHVSDQSSETFPTEKRLAHARSLFKK
jgi:hypothetical protein